MKNKTKRYIGLVVLLLFVVGLVTSCTYMQGQEEGLTEEVAAITDTKPAEEDVKDYSYYEGAEVYFVDVGQGDSTVIVTSSREAIIIDAGEQISGTAVLDVLEEAGVTEVALLVATHPHADHIGGMGAILDKYEVKEIVMSSNIATTKVFERILDKIDEQGKGITRAEVGQQWIIGGITFDVLGVDTVASDSNNSSIVMRMEYGATSILFTGDLEERAEKIVAEEQAGALKSDILSVGHHGSKTSSSELFLEYVQPSIGIISVGEGNRYDHPSPEVIQRLEKKGITILRTDEKGTIKIELDGVDILISEEVSMIQNKARTYVKERKEDIKATELEKVATVIVGEEVYVLEGVYHKKGCTHLEGQKSEVQLRAEAEVEYIRCSKCIED